MSIVTTSDLPECSALKQHIETGDFVDCYAAPCDMATRRAAEIATEFPSWAQALVRLRNILVSPFGLNDTLPESDNTIGFFPVTYETDTEILAGFNDKHLDFRLSILSEGGKIHMATWVHPHNLGGRLYLTLIMPFHILICRNALKRVLHASQA